jgi:hypothetical protein
MPAELFFPELGDLAQARLLLPPDLCGIRQAAGPRVQYPDVAFGFAHEMLRNGDVCSSLSSGHCTIHLRCPLSANSSHGTHPELEATVAEKSATDVA